MTVYMRYPRGTDLAARFPEWFPVQGDYADAVRLAAASPNEWEIALTIDGDEQGRERLHGRKLSEPAIP